MGSTIENGDRLRAAFLRSELSGMHSILCKAHLPGREGRASETEEGQSTGQDKKGVKHYFRCIYM